MRNQHNSYQKAFRQSFFYPPLNSAGKIESISASQSIVGVSQEEEASMGSSSSSRLRNIWRSFSRKKMDLGSRKKLENPLLDPKNECETDLKESKNMLRNLSVMVRS